MKRTLIATLFTLAAAPALAVTPSFNDQPDLTVAKAAGVMGKAAAEAGNGAAPQLWVPNY
jgi:hypothetical protein